MQCRVTRGGPLAGLPPGHGVIEVFQRPAAWASGWAAGPGSWAPTSRRLDSLLVKVTAKAATRLGGQAGRALKEFRVRGVTTNKSFVLNLLQHEDFLHGFVDTSFIAENPYLVEPMDSSNRGAEAAALRRQRGGPAGLSPRWAPGRAPARGGPRGAHHPGEGPAGKSLYRDARRTGGRSPKYVRAHEGLLVTDTTWRDAHQSLLATRLRTKDILNIAPATANALANAYSIENWGGATFDVSMRFLKECPWDRLHQMREAVPDIPFQMLLRGANAVGYTSYPDNVVHQFCKQAVASGMDVFRVFDSLNYLENMRLGVDAVGEAGGIVEAAVCYTGDVSDPSRTQYNLDYYLEFTRQLVDLGIHTLAIKDMAGLLKPKAATMLVGAIRQEFPDLPIHVHTHDTAGTGVASMLACAEAGADAVDAAIDAMSGTTAQPSMGAIAGAVKGTKLDTGLDTAELNLINEYWEDCRGLYAPFESGQKSGSADVYVHEMPGGQYTNLLFQSQQLGLSGQWPAVKRAYATANKLLGDIIKVTPSSKVVGDLAQFLVTQDLTYDEVIERAEELSYPNSVVEYFQGYLGIPPHGFPEPLRSKVLKGKPLLENGKSCFDGRPGAEMAPYDFEREKLTLIGLYGDEIRNVDVLSHAQYPAVFKEFMKARQEYDDLSILDTRTFVEGMKIGQEVAVEIEHGKVLYIKLLAISNLDQNGVRDVIFEMNGSQRTVKIVDANSGIESKVRVKADPAVLGSVGAPMPGVVLEVSCKPGDKVEKGDVLLVLSAMKMETSVAATCSGTVKSVHVDDGEQVGAGDLVVEI
ncbi:unnamed protein product, partial [Heterosigma akashiwo]